MKEKVLKFVTWIVMAALLFLGPHLEMRRQMELLAPVAAAYRMPENEVEEDIAISENDIEEMVEAPAKVPESRNETVETVAESGSKIEETVPETPPANAEVAEVPAETVPESGTESSETMPETPSVSEEVVEAPGEEAEGGAETPSEEEIIYPVLVNGFYIDEYQMITGIDLAQVSMDGGFLELPAEGCIGIRRGALAACAGSLIEVYIPGNITVIEEGAFAGTHALEWLEVDGSNAHFVSIDGVIYDAGVTTMIAVPSARIGTQLVPGSVQRIGANALDATQLSALDMRKCGEISVGANVFGSGTGNGLVIHVDGSFEEVYRNVFAGYQVDIKGYNR